MFVHLLNFRRDTKEENKSKKEKDIRKDLHPTSWIVKYFKFIEDLRRRVIDEHCVAFGTCPFHHYLEV